MDNLILQTVPAIRMMLDPDGRKTLRVAEVASWVGAPTGTTAGTPDLDVIKQTVEGFRDEQGGLGTLRIDGLGTLIAEDAPATGRMRGRIAIITGGAQGFGEGIARGLADQGANIVIADLNEEAGRATAHNLNATMAEKAASAAGRATAETLGGTGRATTAKNRAIFVRTDVADPASLAALVAQTVKEFGGLDLFVSNAGILRAGGLEEMTPETFDRVTRVNYNAWFYCVQAAAPVMKLQTAHSPDYYCDMVQINSKSGLRGSRANFAYAGGKFGGIGLTQSFALELAPHRIKVNSVCPGNFYEGPLWSDPENGLFTQYLKAGKVPGARTVEDVRRHYMAQVPMGKGTSPEDVTRAILYLVEQTCETGQALPVTGGQIMMS